MKLTITLLAVAAVLLIGSASASLKNTQDSSNDLLPTLDVVKEKPLDLDTKEEEDEEEGSGLDDLYEDDEYDEDYDDEYDDEDEDYDEEYYEDDDDDDDPDWDPLTESSGDGLIYDDDIIDDKNDKKKKVDNSNNDLHFDDNVAEKAKKGLFDDSDLLYEYYAEDYEEEYEDKLLQEVIAESEKPEVEEDVVIMVPSDDRSTLFNGHNKRLLVSLFVVSGLASFALFTLAFVLCYWQRRSRRLNGKANLPFVIDASAFTTGRSGKPMAAPMASSIVKNYQRVPTSTKEFLSSNPDSMENPTHVQYQNSGQSQKDSEKPLLP